MLKAVVFDLYDTLVTESGTAVPRAGALGESLGLDARDYRREWKQLRPRVLCGKLTFQESLFESGARLGVMIPAERVQHASEDRARARMEIFQKIDPEIVALTCDLRERGMRLAVISNCMAEDVAEWPASPFAPQFACAVFSFAVGVAKPDSGIYLEAIEQLGVMPEEALYIGDGGDDELAGAERAGLRAAQAGWFVTRIRLAGFPLLKTRQDVVSLVQSA